MSSVKSKTGWFFNWVYPVIVMVAYYLSQWSAIAYLQAALYLIFAVILLCGIVIFLNARSDCLKLLKNGTNAERDELLKKYLIDYNFQKLKAIRYEDLVTKGFVAAWILNSAQALFWVYYGHIFTAASMVAFFLSIALLVVVILNFKSELLEWRVCLDDSGVLKRDGNNDELDTGAKNTGDNPTVN